MDIFKVLELAANTHDVVKWWEGEHGVVEQAVRAVAGESTLSRLPERFRPQHAAQSALVQSRQLRASSTTGFRPRLRAFVPRNWQWSSLLALTNPADSAVVAATSEPTTSEYSLEFAATVRDRGGSPAWLTPETLERSLVFGIDGRTLFFDVEQPGLASKICGVQGFAVRDGRGYVVQASAPDSNDVALQEVFGIVDQFALANRRVEELRRTGVEFDSCLPARWSATEGLMLGCDDSRVAVDATSVEIDPELSLQSIVDSDQLLGNELPGYAQWQCERTLVFGGRHGLVRGFDSEPEGESLRTLKAYYVEFDRLYVATALVPTSAWETWGDRAVDLYTRFTIL